MRRKISLLSVVILLLSLSAPIGALAASGLKISGDVGAEVTIAPADLRKMGAVTALYGALNSSNIYSETEFTGVALSGVLSLAGVKEGATTITFISSDGYKSAKPIGILDEDYLNGLAPILVIDDNDDIQLIIPQKSREDYNKSSWVRQLVEINISGAPGDGGGSGAGDTSGVFADVPSTHWAAAYISDIFERGITTGLSATTFGPDVTLTRAQFVTFLGRLAKVQAGDYSEGPFKDITGAGVDYSAGYINWAAGAGITAGTSSENFSPNDKVTRQQVATFVFRYANSVGVSLNGSSVALKDASTVAAWAVDAVNAVIGAGLMDISDGKFRPNDYCTRAEMAKILSLFPAV